MCVHGSVAAAQTDTLPHTTKTKRLEKWVRTQLRRLGLRQQPDAVFMVSATTGFGVPAACDLLEVR